MLKRKINAKKNSVDEDSDEKVEEELYDDDAVDIEWNDEEEIEVIEEEIKELEEELKEKKKRLKELKKKVKKN